MTEHDPLPAGGSTAPERRRLGNLPRVLMQMLHGPIYRRRIETLVACLLPHLNAGDRVLDVGCGFGTLGRALMDEPACPEKVLVRGLERVVRDEQLIPVDAYDGGVIPHEDESFDVVILADVLHHEADPHRLVAECRRVARRLLVIKDHALEGPFARWRVSLIDWAANAPYGVPCRYEYNTLAQWRETHRRHELRVRKEHTGMRLYPAGVNLLFGGRLQYLVVLEKGLRD